MTDYQEYEDFQINKEENTHCSMTFMIFQNTYFLIFHHDFPINVKLIYIYETSMKNLKFTYMTKLMSVIRTQRFSHHLRKCEEIEIFRTKKKKNKTLQHVSMIILIIFHGVKEKIFARVVQKY